MVSKIEKEVSKGIDLIKSLISVFEEDLKNGSEGLGNVDKQRAMEHRESIIDTYTINLIDNVDNFVGLTDAEFRLFVRNLLIEAEKVKKDRSWK